MTRIILVTKAKRGKILGSTKGRNMTILFSREIFTLSVEYNKTRLKYGLNAAFDPRSEKMDEVATYDYAVCTYV